MPEKAAEALNLEHLRGGDLPALNPMCRAIASLNKADQEKLNAVVCMAEPGDMMAVQQLAENLDQFDFAPGVQTPEEHGKYMIRKSGHFDYDENLEGFYDYRSYGEQHIRQEGGQFNECGYVAYRGTMALDLGSAPEPSVSGSGGERRSSGVSEPGCLRRGKGYGACGDGMRDNPVEPCREGPQMGGLSC